MLRIGAPGCPQGRRHGFVVVSGTAGMRTLKSHAFLGALGLVLSAVLERRKGAPEKERVREVEGAACLSGEAEELFLRL